MREFYQTNRLFLLPASPLCAKALTDYYCRNRDFLKEFEPERDEHFFKEETQRKFLEEEQQKIREKNSISVLFKLRTADGIDSKNHYRNSCA